MSHCAALRSSGLAWTIAASNTQTHMTTTAPKPKASDKRSVAARWGKVNAEAGWTAIPSVLFERQQALRLDSVDLNIVLHLLGPWWEADRYPFLGMETMAAAIGVTRRTIQRHMRELERWGYIKREPQFKDGRQRSNVWDLSGLVKACEPFSREAIEEAEQRRKERAARATRKKPKALTVIPGGKS